MRVSPGTLLRMIAIGAILLNPALCTKDASQLEVEVPSFKFNDLFLLDAAQSMLLANALVTTGIVQVVGIPHYAEVRSAGLVSLAECLKADESGPESRRMADGSLRLTSQAATVDRQPGPMTSQCAEPAAKLRAVVDGAMRQVFSALDAASPALAREALMSPYRSYGDLMQRGEHLEHLHAYYAAEGDADSEAAPRPTVQLHTDAGLLIAMTTGLYSPAAASQASGLYIQLPTGAQALAIVADDALVVMVGDGGARWLAPRLGAPLRAVPHALVADLRAGSQATRSWYGKMYLPPGDAVVPQEGLAYAQYRKIASDALAAAHANNRATVDLSDVLPSACGGSDTRRYLVGDSTTCVDADTGVAGIWCWTNCVPLNYCGLEAQCIDATNGNDCDGQNEHNANCVLTCPGNSTFSGYCYGSGVSMYMAGFTSIVSEGESSTECINLLFTAWTLDSSVKFGFACVGVLLLGVAIQYLTKLRFDLAKIQPPTRGGNALLVVLHCAQIVLGYFIMLVAMTYSVELFCMVCLGLSIGFALFNIKAPPAASTDPCCPPDTETADDENQRGLEAPFLTK